MTNNFLPELHDTTCLWLAWHGCCWLTSEQPGSIIPISKHLFCLEHILASYILGIFETDTTHQQPASNLVTVYILPPWAMLYFKSQLFICVPSALTSIFVTGTLYIFHMGLRINTDYFPKQREPVFICYKNAMCFLVSENQFLSFI